MKEGQKFKVTEDCELLNFLLKCYPASSRKKVKSILTSGEVYYEGQVVTQFNKILKKGSIITIIPKKHYGNITDSRLKIIDETDSYIVVDKPAGLLTIATEKEKENTLYHIVANYVQSLHPQNKIYIVHRLDKDTSGLVLFAKDIKTKNYLQNHWNEMVLERGYWAVVEGVVPSEKGKIENYLEETKDYQVVVTKDKKKGKKSITLYERVKVEDNRSFLRLNLKTGRKNQIRVHMKSIGHPVIGDKKYGSTIDPYHRLALHAYSLVLKDPKTNEIKKWVSKIPKQLQ